MRIIFIAIITAVLGLFVNTGPPNKADHDFYLYESDFGDATNFLNATTIAAFDINNTTPLAITKKEIVDDGGVLDGISREWTYAVFDTGDALAGRKDRVRCLSDKGRRIVTPYRTTVYAFGTTCIVDAIDVYRFKGAGRVHAPI